MDKERRGNICKRQHRHKCIAEFWRSGHNNNNNNGDNKRELHGNEPAISNYIAEYSNTNSKR